MKNTASKIKLAVVAALSCACAIARAENVLYMHPQSDAKQETVSYNTPNYAFADKIGNSLSIAIWVKDRIGPGVREKFIAGVPSCWTLSVPSGVNKNLTFYTQSGTAEANGYVVNDGNWHFLVGTFNYDGENSFQRLYVDGQQVAELTDNIQALPTPTKAFSLGAAAQNMGSSSIPAEWTYQTADGAYGYFAELSVWNRALSDSEVSTLYTRRVGGNESGLVAYWPLTGVSGMAVADYKFPNAAATTGVPNLSTYYLYYNNKIGLDIVDDDGFTKPYVRFVASPEWCAAHSYEQSENATGRSWNDPFTNLVYTATNVVKKFERILCSPGTHKIASAISPLVEYFYLGSYDLATGKPCPETAIIDAQELCRHFLSTDQTTGHQSGFTVENLTFVNGRATSGGSMYFRSNVGKINNCIFHDNAATNGYGGAYYAFLANGTVVSNCQFYGNSAKSRGGAVYTQFSNNADYQRFVDCVFTNNTITTDGFGGGVCGNNKIVLDNCLFADNVADTGGIGGHVSVGKNSSVNGCVFTGKGKADYGGCIGFNADSVVVSNCVIRGLNSPRPYGVFYLADGKSDIQFIDCIITNNTYNLNPYVPMFYGAPNNLLVRQCLIAGNSSDKMIIANQKGLRVFENCTIDQAVVTPATPSAAATNTFINCIIPHATMTSAGNYCNILSNCCVNALQNGPLDSNVWTFDPRFVDAEHGDYTLELRSPCRERGLTLDWMTAGSTDLLGHPRVVDIAGKAFSADALPDLGCYENQERKPSGLMLFVR